MSDNAGAGGVETGQDKGNGAGNGNGGNGGGAPQTVPYADFARVIERRNAAEAEAATLREKVAELQGKVATVDTLTQQLAAKAQEAEAARAKFTSYSQIASRGLLDPDVADAVEATWARMPKTNRPELGAWLDEMKADPTKIDAMPVLLRPHLAAVFAPQDKGNGKGSNVGGHRGGGAGSAGAGAGAPITPDAIFELTKKLQRGEITRDEYNAAVRRPTGT